MQLFFTSNIGNEFTLTSEESKHVTRVLRKKENDELQFTNGEGLLLIAKIISSHKNKTRVEIINKVKKEKSHNYYLHIAIAPTKNIDRFEWFLEKSTEIGIDEITPIICNRSERKIIKQKRCDRILISSIKQSLKYHKPKINESISFQEFIQKDFNGKKYIAHCGAQKRKNLQNENINKKTTILIGPEGDFSNKEIEDSINMDFTSISLHNSRLRTETAGLIATHIINMKSTEK